jgi:flagellar protein FliS
MPPPPPHRDPSARTGAPGSAPTPRGPGTPNAYLRTRVLTAKPEELRLLLLDGAVKFARQGRDGLARRDYEASYNGLSQCRNILVELLTTIREDVDPDLAGKIKALYTFLYTELVNASMEKNVPRADKVIELLEFERQTWVMLMQKLAEEKGAAGSEATMAGVGAGVGIGAGGAPERVPLSIEG